MKNISEAYKTKADARRAIVETIQQFLVAHGAQGLIRSQIGTTLDQRSAGVFGRTQAMFKVEIVGGVTDDGVLNYGIQYYAMLADLSQVEAEYPSIKNALKRLDIDDTTDLKTSWIPLDDRFLPEKFAEKVQGFADALQAPVRLDINNKSFVGVLRQMFGFAKKVAKNAMPHVTAPSASK